MQDSLSWTAVMNEEALVRSAQRGNGSAFEELARRHYASCLRLARTMLRDLNDAEDEVQNACCKAFQHIRQFHREARFSTWLTRIVMNQCLMRLRQGRRARIQSLDEPFGPDGDTSREVPDNSMRPDEPLARRQLRSLVRAEIRKIPPLLRTSLELRDLQELPMEEVASRQGISLAAAKSRLLRARSELRRRVGAHCGRLGPATLLH